MLSAFKSRLPHSALKLHILGCSGEKVPRWKRLSHLFPRAIYLPWILHVPYLHLLVAFQSYFPNRQMKSIGRASDYLGPSLPVCCAFLGEGAVFFFHIVE